MEAKVKVKVFVVINERNGKKEYGDPIEITPSEVSAGCHDVICRVNGATVLMPTRKVGVEIWSEGKREMIIGEREIKKELWRKVWEILKNS